MAETNQFKIESIDDSVAYVLFLILILLIMSSQNTFNNYFELLERQTSQINRIFSTFSNTATGLKALFQTNKVENKDGVNLQ